MNVINLWSGPRNVSTALMYSFAQREDTAVVDEPLYGHYLSKTGAKHPGDDEVISAMNCDGNAVMSSLVDNGRSEAPPILFIKHMAHHLVELDMTFLGSTRNAFLIREPREMLPSLTVQLPHAGLVDTGLKTQWMLYEDLRALGQSPCIIDSRELLLDPASVLSEFCGELGLDFSPAMLSWSTGGIREDGIWAKHWYHAVHKSTGFGKYVAKTDFPQRLDDLLAECQPWYDKLYARALRASLP